MTRLSTGLQTEEEVRLDICPTLILVELTPLALKEMEVKAMNHSTEGGACFHLLGSSLISLVTCQP